MDRKHILINSKFSLGPMSKNIVDTIIEYSNRTKIPFTFIPSRRQIEMIRKTRNTSIKKNISYDVTPLPVQDTSEYNGGYVNNWTTEEFAKYVYSKSRYIAIQRDHGGPGQGIIPDDGYESLSQDCKWFDSIHIDPWKSYPSLNDGIKWTINMINYCYNINKNLYFEIGTEEAIHKFEESDIDFILSSIKQKLDDAVFQRILFCVIQSGTEIKNGINTGKYNQTRLKNMINTVKKYNLQTKEHNGDFMSDKDMINRFEIGLDAINIAPELGILETKTILEYIDESQKQQLYELCYESKKWQKWVDDDFIADTAEKTIIIELSLHYLFSTELVISILSKIDTKWCVDDYSCNASEPFLSFTEEQISEVKKKNLSNKIKDKICKFIEKKQENISPNPHHFC